MANAEKKQGRDSRRGLHLIRLLADSVVEATCSLSHSRFYLWPRDHVPPAFTHVERAGPYHEREEIDWSGLTRSSHRTVTRGRKRSIPPLSLALYFPALCLLSQCYRFLCFGASLQSVFVRMGRGERCGEEVGEDEGPDILDINQA